MSKELYDTSMEIIEKILNQPKYEKLVLMLEELFVKTHISITEIDKERRVLWGYYYEKTIVTPIAEKGNKDLLDLIYQENEIDLYHYKFLKNKTLSVYMVKKVKKDNFMVYDIFNKKKVITLPLTDDWFGINKGDLIQSCLYNSEEPYLSSYGFIHPKGVDKFILKKAKEIIKSKNFYYNDEFLAKLFRKFVNSMRYSRKDALELYNIDL